MRTMMKNDWIKRAAVLLLLVCSYCGVYAQCRGIYQEGLSLMEQKKWSAAITKFNAAKECDSKLAEDCNKQISICRKNINTTITASTPKRETVISCAPTGAEFGANATNRYLDLVVTSYPEDWYVKEGKETEWFTSVRLDSLLRVTCTAANPLAEERSGYIVVRNGKTEKTVLVKQRGKVVFRCDVSELEFDAKGSARMITLESNVAWRIDKKPDWINILNPQDDQLYISTEENTGGKQEGYILLTNEEDDQVVRIECTQKAKSVFGGVKNKFSKD